MHNYLKFIFLVFLLNIKPAFSQTFQWAKSIGGTGNDGTSHIIIDQSLNIYVGISCSFPTTYFDLDTFNINGFNDIFLVKYDNSGNKLWIKQYGGPNLNMTNIKQDRFGDLIFDTYSNSIISVGTFIESIDFGCIPLISSFEDRQIFLTKTDLNGNCIWSKQAGGISDDYGYSLTTDISGNIFITASALDSANFDSIKVDKGGILSKYDPNGNILWSKKVFSYTNTPIFMGSSLQIGDMKIFNNELYLIGKNVEDTLIIDTSILQFTNNYNNILSKFDLNGNLIWYRNFAGPNASYPGKLSFDIQGNCYVTGTFNSGTGFFQNDTIYSTGQSDMYIAKYDSSGNELWVRQSFASQNAYGIGLHSADDGNSYLTGAFAGNANFGLINLSSNTPLDLFIARFSSNGDCIGVKQCDNSEGDDIVSDSNGMAYIAGAYVNTSIFSGISLTSVGNADAFVTKLDVITGDEGEKNTNSNILEVYANPNTGNCIVNIPREFINENNLTFQVYDAGGKIVKNIVVENRSETIKLELENYPKGSYYLHLDNGTKIYAGKVIFE